MTSSALNLPAIPNADEATGLNYSSSPNENILPGSNDVGAPPNSQSPAGLGPIKRKRGRPRKYTLGPFPPQVLKTDGDTPTRINLPLNYSNCEPYSHGQLTANEMKMKDTYLQAAADASSNLKKMKSKQQAVPKYLTHLSSITNGHAEPNATEAAFPLDKAEEALTLAATMASAAAAGVGGGGTTFTFPTSLPQHSAGLNLSMANSLESYHSSKHAKSPMGASYTGFPASTTSSLNGQQASVGAHPFSASRMGSPAASAAAALAAATSLFLDSNAACNNSSNAFMVAPSSVPPAAVSTAAASAAALAACETNLIGRLLPQAEAAVCAARAAGLCGPHAWTPDMVAAFITTLPGCQSLAPVFAENEIDGPALLCLEQHDLMSVLKLKLGPAVKIFGAIRALRRSMMSIPYSDLSEERASAIAAASSCFPVNKNQSPAPRKPRLSNCASPQLPNFSIKRLTTTGESSSADGAVRPQDVSMPLANGVQSHTPPGCDS